MSTAETTESVSAIVALDTIEEFVSYLAPLVDEAKLTFTEDGLRVAAVDPANVAMGDVKLDAAAFEDYEATDTTIAVNVSRFADVLAAGRDSLVQLWFDATRRVLDVQIGSTEYELACIDPDSVRAEPDIPDLDLDSQVTLEADELSHGATVAGIAQSGDSTRVVLGTQTSPAAFVMNATGDTDTMDITLEADDVIDLQVGGDVSSMFSLDYVTSILKPIDDDTEVTVDVGDEYPTRFELQFAEGFGTVTYNLAPRVQT